VIEEDNDLFAIDSEWLSNITLLFF
jgi:hypothetical protein